jgi:CHASE2 domain-containing sensor protein
MGHGLTNTWRTLLRVLRTSAVVAAVCTVLHKAGYFDNFEARWFDAMGQLFPPTPTANVVLVAITDADFLRPDLFAGTSPLHPGALNRLLERVADHRPALIAVDIQLQPMPHEPAERVQSRLQLYSTLFRLLRERSVQWILLQPEPPPVEASGVDRQVQAAWENLQRAADNPARRVRWASAQMIAERGLIRRMSHCVSEDGEHTRMPTLFGAIVEAKNNASGCVAATTDAHEPMLIRYTGAFGLSEAQPLTLYAISAGELLKPPSSPKNGETILSGKTLIVGGGHKEGRDYHWTPFGKMAAVQIWAEAIDSWERQDTPYELPTVAGFLVETIVGAGGGWLMLRFNPLFGYMFALVGLGSLSLLFSWLSFGVGFVFVNSLPSFFAVQLHQRIELWNENRLLRRKNKERHGELASLAASLPLRSYDERTAAEEKARKDDG